MSAMVQPRAVLSLRPLTSSDQSHFRQAWEWMQERPDLYSDNEGYYDLAEFLNPPDVLRYYGLFESGQLIGVASFRLEGKKACRFGLIAPPLPRFRSIASLLFELQRQFFEGFGGEALWIYVPPHSHEVAQKLVGWFGWKPIAPGLFTFTIFDYLNYEQQKDATGRTASH